MELSWEDLISIRSHVHNELATLRLSINADRSQLDYKISKLKTLESRYARVDAMCDAAKQKEVSDVS